MRKFDILTYLIIIVLSWNNIYSRVPSVSTKTDTNNVLIGDQITVDFELKSHKKIDVTWPFLPDSFGKLELLKISKLDTHILENSFSISQKILVTSFDSGNFSIPSLTFSYISEKDQIDSVFSQPLFLQFNTMEVDTTAEIKDIKGPLGVPTDWTIYFIYAAILLFILAVIYFAYRYWQKNKKSKDPELDYDPSIPPHILALEALRKLEDEKVWQNGRVKEYYIRLTDIIRVYIKRQFSINALEMITSEILESMKKNKFDSEMIEQMRFVFETADFAKFAKLQPLPDENAKVFDISRQFVENTFTDADNELNISIPDDDKEAQKNENDQLNSDKEDNKEDK